MTIKVQTPDGGIAQFPDGTDASAIERAMLDAFPAPGPGEASTTGDVLKSIPAGIVKGVAGGVTLPMGLHDMAGAAGGFAAEQTVGRLINAYKTGGADWSPAPHPEKTDTLLSQLPSLPRQDDVVKGVESITGPLYQPQTRAGKYAERISEFVPMSLAGPGNMLRNAFTFGAVPAVASEAAGQATEGTSWEGPARIAGAIGGGVLGLGANKAITGTQNYATTKGAANEIGGILNQPNIPTGAVRRVAESVQADGLTPSIARSRGAELGDEAMLLDMGRQLGGRAEAIAAQPGRGQNTVLDAVEGRTGNFGERTAERVKQTLDQTMGSSPNVVELQKKVEGIVDSFARPAYKNVMNQHPVVWDTSLEELAKRPAIAQGMQDAVSLAKNYGETIVNPFPKHSNSTSVGMPGQVGPISSEAKPSLQYWDYVKKAIDARINKLMKGGGIEELGSKDKADLGGLIAAKNDLVSHLDDLTGGAYANARKMSATKFELREAADVGRGGLSSKLLPEEFAAQIDGMSLPEKAMAQAHFRREIDRIIESARNDGAAARRILDTDNNAAKIEAIFGPQAVTDIQQRIAAETQFQNIKTKVADNSRTQVRSELVKDTATPSTGMALSTSIPGIMHAGARGSLNYLRNQGMTQTRDGIADLLTKRGPEMQQLIKIMSDLAGKRSQNAARSPTRLPLSLAPNSLLLAPQSRE